MKRRELITGTVAAGIASLAAIPTHINANPIFSDAVRRPRRPRQGGLRRLGDGLPSSASLESVMQRNFSIAIEQNFSTCTPAQANRVFQALSRKEIDSLGLLYNRRTRDMGRPGAFLRIAAERLEAKNLSKLIPQFGYSEVYASAATVSAQKALQTVGHFDSKSPKTSSPARESPAETMGSVGMLDYTIQEIYLSFRTAPVGALTPAASAFETATFVGSRLSTAFGAGYAVGSGIAWAWSTYFPESWDRSSNVLGTTVDKIGDYIDTVRRVVVEIGNAPTPVLADRKRREQGHNERMGFSMFGVEEYTRDDFEDYGGDYEVAFDWSFDWNFCDQGCR